MRVLVLALLAGLVALALSASSPSAPSRTNPVQAENAQPGSTGWRFRPAAQHAIEGYASQASAAPGDTLELHVSTAHAASYRIEIYRLGWYGGAGGRLMACAPASCADEPGRPQALTMPAGDGFLDAGWPVTDRLTVPPTWVSGYYSAVLRLTTGPAANSGNSIPFVVRAPPPRQSAILVQAPVNTWQAYNDWGGTSLYHDSSGAPCKGVCTRVSFDRPYAEGGPHGLWPYELPLVHFLEKSGYDVSYTTDVDTDADPGELLRHRLVIVDGHGEYWTKTMRDAFDTARSVGTNLAFLGANTGYWQMRYADDRRTIVEYRLARLDPEPNPALKTVRFRELGRPECELEGIEYVRAGGESIGGPFDYGVAPGGLSDPWFAGTALTASSVLPGLVGYEWDALSAGCRTPPSTVLFHYGGPPAPADAVRFTAPSGAVVFSAGSLSFAQGLDDWRSEPRSLPSGDPRLEAFMANVLADLERPAPPRVSTSAGRGRVRIELRRARDPRVEAVSVFRAPARDPLARGSRGMHLVCRTLLPSCLDSTAPRGRAVRYVVVVRDPWGSSVPLVTRPVAAR